MMGGQDDGRFIIRPRHVLSFSLTGQRRSHYVVKRGREGVDTETEPIERNLKKLDRLFVRARCESLHTDFGFGFSIRE